MKWARLPIAVLATFLGLVPVAQAGPTGTDQGAFHADCQFSHRANDDPIVFFEQPGVSHSHDFFGGQTNAFSTNQSLRLGTTSCVRDDEVFKNQTPPEPRADKSGYWEPTLLHNGEPVDAIGFAAYYAAGIRDVQAIQPYPEDLKVIAGSAAGGPSQTGGRRIYQLRRLTDRTERTVAFPDCWNGVDSDSANHKSHMAYAQYSDATARYECPASHPVLVPALRLVTIYPPLDGTITFASGGLNTDHADFMNGWDVAELDNLVEVCLNADEYCGGTDGPAH